MEPTITSIKEKLHRTIECIDDEKVLEAFYTILGSYRNEAEDYELTDEQFQELKKEKQITWQARQKAIVWMSLE